MQYPAAIAATIALLFNLGIGGRLETKDSSELEPTSQTTHLIRWHKRTVDLSFSTSLLSPGANIKAGSDVVGAARRALTRWSSMANINFAVTWSSATSVSPSTGGDGISLLTIADTLDNETFNSDSTTGRTRLFYDPDTGAIAEADISINPRPRSEEGAELQFSTDGTPGTYDLEATFTHEIGHLLGLDHSAMLASTMQQRQAFNGTFGQPALTERTLSEDDRQRVRNLYGPKLRLGRIEGKLADNRTPGSLIPLSGVNVWAENVVTGRVMSSDITDDDGSYQLEGLTPGQYRVLAAAPSEPDQQKQIRSFEVSNMVAVKSDSSSALNYNLVPPQPAALNPRVIGLNGELSTVALPLEPGRRVKVYLGGEGIDQVPGTSIVVNSPYFTVDPATLTREQVSTPFPVVSVEVQVAPNAPFGDYTIRLQSNSGETAFLPGALTIDPGVMASVTNPVDDSRFFIRQHLADFVGAEPDQTAIEKLNAQLSACGLRSDCLRARRLDISTTLLQSEVNSIGVFLQALYSTGLGRNPRFSEFESDRTAMANRKDDVEKARQAFVTAFVRRPEFIRKYSPTMKPEEFVDTLLLSLVQNSGVDLSAERAQWIDLLNQSDAGRVALLTRVANHPSVIDAYYNQALVRIEYFTHLRREPDDDGYRAWVTVLKNKPLRDPETTQKLVCSFLNSGEYQSRFGMVATHSNNECGLAHTP
jgi:hypothetical protein